MPRIVSTPALPSTRFGLARVVEGPGARPDACQRERRARTRLELVGGDGVGVTPRLARRNDSRCREHDAEEDHERNEGKTGNGSIAGHVIRSRFLRRCGSSRTAAGQRDDRQREREQRRVERLLQPEEKRTRLAGSRTSTRRSPPRDVVARRRRSRSRHPAGRACRPPSRSRGGARGRRSVGSR